MEVLGPGTQNLNLRNAQKSLHQPPMNGHPWPANGLSNLSCEKGGVRNLSDFIQEMGKMHKLQKSVPTLTLVCILGIAVKCAL